MFEVREFDVYRACEGKERLKELLAFAEGTFVEPSFGRIPSGDEQRNGVMMSFGEIQNGGICSQRIEAKFDQIGLRGGEVLGERIFVCDGTDGERLGGKGEHGGEFLMNEEGKREQVAECTM